MKPNQRKVIVVVIYRHPHNNVMDFISEVENSLTTISSEQKNLYYTDDININLNSSVDAVQKSFTYRTNSCN